MTLKVMWIDGQREPRCPPNPKYPTGIDVDTSRGAAQVCWTAVPYPAKRCGLYRVQCTTCGQQVMVTTAGRTDDPRTVKLACKVLG